MRRRILLGSAMGLALARPALVHGAAGGEVDLLLVLAADVSRSMEEREIVLQREGYAAALMHPSVVGAIRSGPFGAVALTYVEWSSAEDQRLLVPWMRVGNEVTAAGFAAALAEAPLRVGDWTSISGALRFARELLADAPYACDRKVVDVSGDGTNNHGGPVEVARDQAVEAGITVNGLPVLREDRAWASAGHHPSRAALVRHYQDAVIGGFGAFVMPASGLDSFAGAIRRKLVLEIAMPAAPRPAVG